MKKELLWCTLLLCATLFAQPGCNDIFTDNGGPNLPYSLSETVTISPDNPGERVTVAFTSFAVEPNFDALYVYDGNSIAAPQIMSNNGPGSVPNGGPGGFWGIEIPGPFTSTSPDGSLTFRFISDGGIEFGGWIANVICSPQPTFNCDRPSSVNATTVTATTANLSWVESNPTTSQWEVIVQPYGSAQPSPSDSGQIVSTNSYQATGLLPSRHYVFYVRGICPDSGTSNWTTGYLFVTRPLNDDCGSAIVIPINSGSACVDTAPASVIGATASGQEIGSCIGVPDDDVWFQFTATEPTLKISLWSGQGIASVGTLDYAVYSGSCDNLSPFGCSSFSPYGTLANLTVGETYYLRVYSTSAASQLINFSVCLSNAPSCANARPICPGTDYVNTTGIGSTGGVGCLAAAVNPTYFSLKVDEPGSIKLHIKQSSLGSSTPNLDVDYVYWGPYASLDEACTAIANNAAPATGSCGYSTAPSDLININNAQTGQYYIFMVTNFSNVLGNIRFEIDPSSTGTIDCSGLRLNAFLDSNGNGTQDTSEANFPLGQFQYEINNDGIVHNISSPSGRYLIYDGNVANTYDLSYSINPEFGAVYNCSTTYSDLSASGGITTLNFPVTATQLYNDLTTSITALSAPPAGSTYALKIVYANNGNQTTSGIVTFTHDAALSIIDISQTGAVSNPNGFTYAFTNLIPFESRSITVTLAVPPLPIVAIGQLVTNTVSVTIPEGDIQPNNNSASCTQAINAAYDPNDKMEAHGPQILFSTFQPDEYLVYTIRFENTGTIDADDVLITDTLDAQLDETSVTMLSASHNYTLDRVGNELSWHFADINLPVSIADTNIGKGFVTFKVKPKSGFTIGDVIPNTADIFFDSNPPITTNTFETEFVSSLGNTTVTNNNVAIYPNPTHASVNVKMAQTSETIASITVYDIVGKNVKTMTGISGHETSVDLSSLSAGIYLIEIETDSGSRLLKKLIKQ